MPNGAKEPAPDSGVGTVSPTSVGKAEMNVFAVRLNVKGIVPATAVGVAAAKQANAAARKENLRWRFRI